MTTLRLAALPAPLKTTITAFLLTVSCGYALGLVFVDRSTRLHPAGIAERFRGTEAMGIDPNALPADREIQPGKSAAELLTIVHAHVLALAVVFALTAAVFSFTTVVPARWKRVVIVEPFVGLAATFGGMFLVRYAGPGWSVLVAASGLLMTAAFAVMVVATLLELWRTPRPAPSSPSSPADAPRR